MKSLTAAMATSLIWFGAPAMAAAATRYAAPAGVSSASCPQAAPCDLATAVNDAAGGDTVVVEPGTYGSAASPIGALNDNGHTLTIEGAAIGGRPTIYQQTSGSGPSASTVILSGTGSSLQDLTFIADSAAYGVNLSGSDESATRVSVTVTNTKYSGDACEVLGTSGTLTDSLCISEGSAGSGAGVQAGASATFRNDTLVGDVFGLFTTGATTAINTILHYTTTSGPNADLWNAGGTLTLTDCEYATLFGPPPTSTGHVSGAPVFTDTAYHVGAGSPGVDHGVDAAANGPYDLDGNLRTLGSHTDIGAYEVLPTAPTVTTGLATGVGQAQATIGGTIAPAGGGVQYHFEYGTSTPAYGASTAVTPVPGQSAAESPTATLAGLNPSTTYHYRLVAEIDGTEYDGADQRFTTAALPSPPAPQNTAAPVIQGAAKHGSQLSCAPGSWTGSPSHYAYQWLRDGTPIDGATGAGHKVAVADEGQTLTCTVTATGAGGSSKPATSAGVKVSVPVVRRCPAATGSVSGANVGRVHLGMSRKQARRAYSRSSTRGYQYKDFFCLTPYGVRVGYASPKLLAGLRERDRARLSGRVVWISTDNARYAVNGVRAGATVAFAKSKLRGGYLFRVGKNDWYLARTGGATAVLKVRSGLVEEVGIAERSLTNSHKADRRLMTSFY